MDTHVPTGFTSVNSGQSLINGNATPTTREELLQLMEQKDLLEGELKTLGALLDAHNVTMQTPLTTFDGYPRDDIDIAPIRTARSRIIHLRNDYKHLMSQIEKGLHSFHSSQAVPPSPPSTTITPPEPHQPPGPSEAPDIPFAEVDLVISGSPADTAGLKLGDKVKRFGNVHLLSHDPLSRVVEVVGNNEGREVRVLVERGRGVVEGVEDVELVLTPRRGWGGRGLLGCHLKPL